MLFRSLFALPLYGAGMGADSVLFYRYVLAVVMLGVLMLVRRQSFAVSRREIVPLMIMGLLFSASSLLLFESYNLMDAGIASTILFVYPVMVAVIMAVGFHERVTVVTVLSIVLACAGISLLYKGGDGSTLNLTGVILVFLSALSYAIYIVGINRSSLRKAISPLVSWAASVRRVFCIRLSALRMVCPAWFLCVGMFRSKI